MEKIKLLIVDDSSIMRRTIEYHIKNANVEIIGMAGNGIDALTLIAEKKPDIVTLDITMPEMDGLSCLEKIMEIAPDTKVIVITALADKLTGLIALDKGAQSFLRKPVTGENLKEVFNEVMKVNEYE
jgi:two-component system chemotaxis response regulator CheY